VFTTCNRRLLKIAACEPLRHNFRQACDSGATPKTNGVECAVKSVGENWVVFGSDFSIKCSATVIARIQHAFITPEQKRKILAGDPEALLENVKARTKSKMATPP